MFGGVEVLGLVHVGSDPAALAVGQPAGLYEHFKVSVLVQHRPGVDAPLSGMPTWSVTWGKGYIVTFSASRRVASVTAVVCGVAAVGLATPVVPRAEAAATAVVMAVGARPGSDAGAVHDQ